MPDLPGAAFWEVLGWRPETLQLEQLSPQDQLRSWNSRVNPTRLVEGDDYWINQVFDSLWPLQEELRTPHQSRLAIDVGTGVASRARRGDRPSWHPDDPAGFRRPQDRGRAGHGGRPESA